MKTTFFLNYKKHPLIKKKKKKALSCFEKQEKKKFIILKTKKIYKDSERFERDRKIEKKEDFFQKEIWVGVGLKQKGLNNVGREYHYLYIFFQFFLFLCFGLLGS